MKQAILKYNNSCCLPEHLLDQTEKKLYRHRQLLTDQGAFDPVPLDSNSKQKYWHLVRALFGVIIITIKVRVRIGVEIKSKICTLSL